MQDAPDVTVRRDFAAWLAADPTHAAAYAAVGAAGTRAAQLADEPALLALRHEALARASLRSRRRFGRRSAAAAILLLTTAPLAAWSYRHWQPPAVAADYVRTFRTNVGQQADVTLPDGSTVRLDTATRLRVSFTAGERRVALDGQGWFVVKPTNRPFVIAAAGRDLQAEAGRFDVRTDPGMVRAFADEGTLSLATGSSSIALRDGRLLTIRGDEAAVRRLDRPMTFTGWREGMLLFDDVPLAAAVGELNRYRRQPIGVADRQAGALRISGAFRTADTIAFVDAVKRGLPVRVDDGGTAGMVIASR